MRISLLKFQKRKFQSRSITLFLFHHGSASYEPEFLKQQSVICVGLMQGIQKKNTTVWNVCYCGMTSGKSKQWYHWIWKCWEFAAE